VTVGGKGRGEGKRKGSVERRGYRIGDEREGRVASSEPSLERQQGIYLSPYSLQDFFLL